MVAEGRRRPQLLARRTPARARHSDALDHDWVGATRNAADARSSSWRRRCKRSGHEPALPGDRAAGVRRASTRCSTQYCSDCHRPTRRRRSRRTSPRTRRRRGVSTRRCRRSISTIPASSRFVSACAANRTTAGPRAARTMRTPCRPRSRRWPTRSRSRRSIRPRHQQGADLYDGTIASGGNRYENNVIALYEFKTGNGQRPRSTRAASIRRRISRCRATSTGSAAGASTSRRRRQGAGLDHDEPQVPAADHCDGRILDRSVGRARQRDAGRRAHRQLLRQHDGPQLHAGPDAVQLRLLRPQHGDRRQRHAAAVDATMTTSACRRRCSTSS